MYDVGIDVGGTKIAIGLVSEDRVIQKDQIRTPESRSVKEIVRAIGELVQNMAPDDQYENIGVGFAGVIKNGMVTSPNLAFRDTNLQGLLTELLPGKRIEIENDANAAAYAELCYGALKGSRNALFITLGTGVGGGIILDGRLYKGSFGVSGELGHQVIDCNGKRCGCGRMGCFESYASTSALVERCRKKEGIEKSLLFESCKGEKKAIDGRMIMEAYQANDELARTLIYEHIKYICVGIVNLLNIFDPEKIAIGGGVSQSDVIIDLIREEVKQTPTLRGSNLTEIVPARFCNDAGIIGAANLYRMI